MTIQKMLRETTTARRSRTFLDIENKRQKWKQKSYEISLVTFQQKRNKGAIDPVTRSSKRDPKIIALEIPSVCLQTSLQTLNLLCLHLCAFCHACVMRVCVCIIQMCAPTLQALARISWGRNSISHRRCKKWRRINGKEKRTTNGEFWISLIFFSLIFPRFLLHLFHGAWTDIWRRQKERRNQSNVHIIDSRYQIFIYSLNTYNESNPTRLTRKRQKKKQLRNNSLFVIWIGLNKR